MAEQKNSSTGDEGLKVLVDAKIVNPNITLSQLLEITKRLDGDEGPAAVWSFIVKGKYIYKDDSAAKVQAATAWPPD